MVERIESVGKSGQISKEVRSSHRGFSQWEEKYSSSRDHDTILQV